MSILNNMQSREASRAYALVLFLNQNKNIYNLFAPFSNEVTNFLSNTSRLSTLASEKEKKGTGITIQKRELKKSIAREGANLCNIITAYAHTTGNTTLKHDIRYTYTNLYTLKDGDVRAVIINLAETIKPLLAKADFAAYAITADNLTSILNKANTYNNSIGSANILNHKSNYASQNITATLKKIKDNIAQFNRLLHVFSKQHPGFIAGFRETAAINHTGVRHNTIEGSIINNLTNQPVSGVTITGEGENKSTVTNASGFYQLAGIKTGTHTLTITAEGYTTQVITVKIIRGKTMALNIHLEAQLLNLPNTEVA